MSKSAPLLLLATLGLAAACAPTLAGHLKGPNGEPITGAEARVNIQPLDDAAEPGSTVVVTVDGDGAFATDASLKPGPYLVEALVPGYGVASRKVTVGEDGEPLVLKLSPLAKTKAKAIGANVEADGARGAGGATLTPPSL